MPFDRIITVGLNPAIDRVMEVPGLRIGDHVKGRVRSYTPAGKAFNVSRVLATLGVPNRAMGFLGRDAIDLYNLSAQLAGIETDWTPIDARTRDNLTLIDPIAGSATHIRDAGPTIRPDDLHVICNQLEQASTPGMLMVFCGSLPPGVSAEDFGRLIDRCQTRGAAVAVDTSGEALRRAVQSRLWLVKPNAEELSEIAGRPLKSPSEIREACKPLHDRCEIIVVTLGDRGACAITDGHCWQSSVHVEPELIRSTVGCGDTFLAGFIAACQNGEPLPRALVHANAVAAASALSDLPASFSEQDRLNLLAQATVTELK